MAISNINTSNPFDENNPIKNGYGWTVSVMLDASIDSGRMTINIHPNELAWRSNPLKQITIGLGQLLAPATPGDPSANPPIPATPAKKFKTLSEFMQDPEFVTAYNTIGQKLYAEAIEKHPDLAGATIV